MVHNLGGQGQPRFEAWLLDRIPRSISKSNDTMTTRPLYVGIDLGTTNSTVAVFDGEEITLIRNNQGSVLTPSVVRIDARGNVTVGARARRFLDTDPANTRSEFKRLMGTTHQLEFPASGTLRRPEELSAEVLKSLRQDVADQLGVAPERAVVSVPALFELHQTAAASNAAMRAGFERVELIQEPVASAIAAGWTQGGSSGPWLVYDLGGGTFDVSLLETREGLLRVVGHDGDNFLGGRDLDRALMDLALAKLAADGVVIDRANPQHARALRQLRLAAEEAKIELTRSSEAPIFIAGLDVDGLVVDVDLTVTRPDYEAAIGPLIDRSLAICASLLAANGLGDGALERVVLVGGPTVTPLLRERVRAVLGADFGEGLDPMTLVAQGAALFAGTVALDGRPAAKAPPSTGPKVWLQFPAMTSDLTPFVVGKLLESSNTIKQIRISRSDGEWQSEPTPCEADGTFAVMVRLKARQNTSFEVQGLDGSGHAVTLQPASFSITHGITLGDPPLSRSVGVALADNRVQVYFNRGSPLPIRRTFVLHTVETVHPGTDGHVLKVPIVQGEFAWAHLCRLVGTLEIPSTELSAPLPVGSEVELMLELDRGGQLRAQARIANIDRIFDQVALLMTPQVSLETLADALVKLRTRAADLSRAAFLDHSGKTAARLSAAMPRLDEAEQNIKAARGGDLDAGEQARRILSDFDALLAEIEAEQAWPELGRKIEESFAMSLSWVAGYGSDAERLTLNETYQACKRAFVARDADEVERQRAVIERLGVAAYFRHPGSWEWEFERCAARVGESTDVRRASELVAKGREAVRQRDRETIEQTVRELWRLAPVDHDEQKLGHGSGLRKR
jgi:molecular chaperone DnaK